MKSLISQHEITIVGVAGSIGKTGTKRAIATVLSQKYRVRWQDGNYNDVVSVPLIFFGLDMPSLTSPIAWMKIFRAMKREIANYNYNVVVIELGTDGPGQIARFAKYITVDIGVLTRIAPEHMEYFSTIDAVAKEELSLQNFSTRLIVHEQIVEDFGDLLNQTPETFGKSHSSTSRFSAVDSNVTIQINEKQIEAKTQLTGEHQIWGLSAAALVASSLGLNNQEITKGIESVTPASGRMQMLKGIKNSTIIDDTYNANAESMMAALETLGKIETRQRIAVLGNMNEMGDLSEEVHRKVGNYVDPKKIHTVLTIGADANKYLAECVERKGVKVFRFDKPEQVGSKLKEIIHQDAAVLLKGSQNGVFLEDAIKPILNDPNDISRLVRQSPEWIAKKSKLLAQVKSQP